MTDIEGNGPKWLEWLNERFSNGDTANLPPELNEILTEATASDSVDQHTLAIIKGALQMSNLRARDIMVPRTSMICINENDTAEQVLATFDANPHSRFPVVGDDSNDIKGIVHAKDITRELIKEQSSTSINFDSIMRKPNVIAESKPLNELLQEFRTTRQHMAIVVDEYTQVSGLATIEDVLEQIVGRIVDEHDAPDEVGMIGETSNGTYVIKGETSISEFNEYFESNLSDEEFNTISGIVVSKFGRVPDLNEEIDIEDFHFEVARAEERKVSSFRMTKKTQ